MKILLVEDSQYDTNKAEKLLTEMHFEVITAKSVNEAVKLYDLHMPDIVVTDYSLQVRELSGIDLIGILKKRNPLVIVVVMCINPTVDTVIKAMKQGAFDYIQKPLDITKVQRFIKEAQIKALDLVIPNAENERDTIQKALNDSPTYLDAANLLKMDVATLWRKRKALNIDKTNKAA